MTARNRANCDRAVQDRSKQLVLSTSPRDTARCAPTRALELEPRDAARHRAVQILQTCTDLFKNVDSNNINSNVKSSTEHLPRKKCKLNPADEHFANILERSIDARNKNVTEKKEEDDEDKLFCLSLVKEIKKVSENRRLKLKIEMYNLLERYQSAEVQPFEKINYPSTSYSLQQQPRSSFRSPQYRDSLRYSARESSTQYGYTTSSYASPPTNLSQGTSPGSYEDSQELDLFDYNN
ncbi:hypothetical protein EVAR_31728_1 [Eumeta japonica]|uniref:BESS domain-containing protein n=1 Tax=Eumeta variegata TaxID=151549 RepID=A0A4C1YM71_EUMVA|nr:hypothetical protein EVAR_31728_1 [Eumeta japonica]